MPETEKRLKLRIPFIFLLVALLFLLSCRAARQPVSSHVVVSGTSHAPVTAPAAAYIQSYKDLAINEMKRTGVPASITLAQGMLESDYGRSTLARTANNHFGIKCHNDWKGQSVRQHDDRRNECFRKYQKIEDSFYDHSDFLRSGSRYSFLFELNPLDYKAWAHGLKKAGYATNPDYAHLLIRKIEENKLHVYDEMYTASAGRARIKAPPREPASSVPAGTAEKPAAATTDETVTFAAVLARVPAIKEKNKIQYIIVAEGDTREKLENEFQLLRWELPRYNELKEDFVPFPGQILYLQPKRDKAEAGNDFHTAAEGETMYSISQQYGIRLGDLLEMNRMAPGTEPTAGQKIWLRSMKPAGG